MEQHHRPPQWLEEDRPAPLEAPCFLSASTCATVSGSISPALTHVQENAILMKGCTLFFLGLRNEVEFVLLLLTFTSLSRLA